MKKKLGLVLASGGAKGYIHIGVLKRLEEENITPDVISGSSIGALVGAMYALGYSVKEIEDMALKYDKKYLIEYRIPSISLLNPIKINKLLKEIFGNKKFEDTKIKLYIAATNLTDEKPEYISKGLIYEAVRKSIAIPGAFPPIKEKFKMYIDGGILSPIPIEPAKKEADIILAVKFYYDFYLPFKKTPEIIDLFLKTLSATGNNITQRIIEKEKPNILLDCIESKKISTLDFKDPLPYIKIGYDKMDDEIENLKKLLKKSKNIFTKKN